MREGLDLDFPIHLDRFNSLVDRNNRMKQRHETYHDIHPQDIADLLSDCFKLLDEIMSAMGAEVKK